MIAVHNIFARWEWCRPSQTESRAPTAAMMASPTTQIGQL